MIQWRCLCKELRMLLEQSKCLVTVNIIFIVLLWNHNDPHRRLILGLQKKYCSSALVSVNLKKFLTFPAISIQGPELTDSLRICCTTKLILKLKTQKRVKEKKVSVESGTAGGGEGRWAWARLCLGCWQQGSLPPASGSALPPGLLGHLRVSQLCQAGLQGDPQPQAIPRFPQWMEHPLYDTETWQKIISKGCDLCKSNKILKRGLELLKWDPCAVGSASSHLTFLGVGNVKPVAELRSCFTWEAVALHLPV